MRLKVSVCSCLDTWSFFTFVFRLQVDERLAVSEKQYVGAMEACMRQVTGEGVRDWRKGRRRGGGGGRENRVVPVRLEKQVAEQP